MTSTIFSVSRMIFFCSAIFFSILISAYPMFSKNIASTGASINGYVKDSLSKETIIGATVYIKGTRLGTYTNKSGYFSIVNVPPGEYDVQVTSVGYKKLVRKIEFSGSGSIRHDFTLEPQAIMSGEISVEAEREVEKRQITVSKINVPIKQIKEIRIGGESDVFRTLQMLPGILTSSQMSSGLFVRGGSPDQNLVLLDGVTVYNPTHLFGFISTFNSDAIKDVELIKGGFPAEYGGRLSAVLNVTQKDGNREEVEGIGSIGLISSKLGLEGPIGNGSWFIGGRRTYFELVKGLMEEDPESPIPDFSFYDLNGKITQDIGRNDKIFFSGFLSADNLEYDASGVDMNLDIGNRIGALRWTHIFSTEMFSTMILSGSRYFNNFFVDQSGYEAKIENSITDYSLKGHLEWLNSDKLTTKFGFEISRYTFELLQNFTGDTDTTEYGSTGGSILLKEHDFNYSIYSQINYQPTALLSLQAGIRGYYWEERDRYLVDPRAAIRYQFQENLAVKLAWGIYHQNLRLASMQDFSFFDTWLPTDNSVEPSYSQHVILSFETEPMDGYNLNFDVYYKQMKNISELNQNSLQGDKVADVFYIGDAESYGAEIFIQKKFGNFTGWMGYALGYITARFDSINHGKEFRPKYDRRHDFKIVAQYEINESWELGASFVFQSGQSYTGATSRFQSRMPGQNYGDGKIVTSERYGLRLPASHQLNANVSHKFKTFGLDSRLILDIYNVYNHRDIWFRYYDTQSDITEPTDIKLLPILPTFSYEIKF